MSLRLLYLGFLRLLNLLLLLDRSSASKNIELLVLRGSYAGRDSLGSWRAPRGWCHCWVRRWSMRCTMTAMASIVAWFRGGMAAHVWSQYAIASPSTPAEPLPVS